MATVTRLFENRVQTTVGNVYSPNCNAYLFTIIADDSSIIDLRAEDDAVNEVVEQVVKEFNPLAYFITNDNSGTMHMILDKNQNNRDELQIQLRRIGLDPAPATTTSIGPNDIDISQSTVEEASSITIA
jgi:hypothetical protein